MNNYVKLEIFTKDKLLETKTYDLETWYDGDIQEIDDAEYKKINQITLIKGRQYGSNGELESAWVTFFDELGRLVKSERYDSDLNLIESEEIKYDQDGKMI
jgi:hypothetical protein